MILIISNRAIAIAVGQSILVITLSKKLVKLISVISVEAVVKVDPLNLSKTINSRVVLASLRTAYNHATHNVLIYSLAANFSAMPFVLGMQWLNVKKAAQCWKMVSSRDEESSI